MALSDRNRLSEEELNIRYTQAAYKFAQVSGWRAYIELADEFRELGTYKDASQMYTKCIKAASAPAYREITEQIRENPQPTAEEYREAARIMKLIQDYSDAREVMRVYTIQANNLTYDAAMALLSNHDATDEELGRGVDMLLSIKGFKDTRALLDRYQRFYFERMYRSGSDLMEKAHVFSEFDEAAEIFEKIKEFSDAADKAAQCRKQADKIRPKKQKQKPQKPAINGDQVVKVGRGERKASRRKAVADEAGNQIQKPRRAEDETRNTLKEVWQTIDKRYFVFFILWIVILVVDVYLSIMIPRSTNDWIIGHSNEMRALTLVGAGVSIGFSVFNFLRMLTASLRKKLAHAAFVFGQKLIQPLIRAVNKVLMSIGIDLSRRNRLGGKDEKKFVFKEEQKEKKHRKRLKNDLKWVEQPDNAARVRFIFIDYMIRHIRNGYRMRPTMTPREIGEDLAFETDEKELFRLYDLARYAGSEASGEISDRTIGELKAINQRKV